MDVNYPNSTHFDKLLMNNKKVKFLFYWYGCFAYMFICSSCPWRPGDYLWAFEIKFFILS